MNINDLGFSTEEESASERGVSKPVLALITLAVAAVAIGLVSAFSWLVTNNGTQTALEEYEHASKALDTTSQNITTFMSEYDKVLNRAAKAHTGGLAVVAAAAKDRPYFSPASSINDLKKEVARLTKTANLVEAEDGTIAGSVARPKDIDQALFQLTANSDRQALKNATRHITDSQENLDHFATTLTEGSEDTKAAIESVRDKSSALIAAARASHKSWKRPERSSDESWANYQDALKLLHKAPEASLARQSKIIAKYVKTRKAVEKSHDKNTAKFAEQQRLAQEAAQRAAAQQRAAAEQREAAQRAAAQRDRDRDKKPPKEEPKPKKTQDHQGLNASSDVVYQSDSCVWSKGPVTYLASKGWTLRSASDHCAGR